MVNEDQTRFCAECGARLGPNQAPQAPPPKAGFATPSSEPSAAEIDRLKKMSNRPEVPQTDGVPRNPFDPRNDPRNQPQNQPPQADPGYQSGSAAAQDKPVKRLRSPLLAGEEDYEDEPPPEPRAGGKGRPAGGAPSHGRGLHSPLLGDSGAADYPPEPIQGTASGRKHLHSPLLGDALGEPQDYPPEPIQGSASGRKHLHSPLLGGGEDDDYYEEEQPRRGGLHSPILGGGGGGGGARGLRSPILGGAASGGFDDYEEYEEDPYADEGNPNILRSPLLSAKMELGGEDPAHHQPNAKAAKRGQAAAAQPQGYPQQAPQGYPAPQAPGYQQQQQQPQGYPPQQAPAYPAQQAQNYPPPQQAAAAQQAGFAPQQQAPAFSPPQNPGFAPQQGAAFQPQPEQSTPPQAPAFQAPAPAAVPPQAPSFSTPQPGFSMPQQSAPPQVAPASAFSPSAVQAAIPAADPAPKTEAASSFEQAPGATHSDEAFPDMSKYRRDGSPLSSSSQAGTPSPILPLTTAALPDPQSYVPPELAPAAPPAPSTAPVSYAPAKSFSEPETAAPPVRKEEKPLKRSSSKLLGGDDEDEMEEAFGNRQPGNYREPAAYGAQPAKPSSPMPKVLGGFGILMALGKLPLLMACIAAGPQFQNNLFDCVATMLALLALGLGLILS